DDEFRDLFRIGAREHEPVAAYPVAHEIEATLRHRFDAEHGRYVGKAAEFGIRDDEVIVAPDLREVDRHVDPAQRRAGFGLAEHDGAAFMVDIHRRGAADRRVRIGPQALEARVAGRDVVAERRFETRLDAAAEQQHGEENYRWQAAHQDSSASCTSSTSASTNSPAAACTLSIVPSRGARSVS